MRKLIEQAKIEDIYDFLEKCMNEDIKLANKFLARFAEPDFDDALDRLENEIDSCMDHAEHCRDDWGSMVFDTGSVTSQIEEYIEKGHLKLAFSALEIMLQRLHGLLEMEGECEVSSEINSCVELMVSIADKVDYSGEYDDPDDFDDFNDYEDSEDAEDSEGFDESEDSEDLDAPKDSKGSDIKKFLFEHCLEHVLTGYGDDYGLDASESMLQICVRFVTRENRSEIEKFVKTRRPKMYLDIVRRFDGEKAADDYIQAHLDNSYIIEIAYDQAMGRKDYAEAEKLLNTILDRQGEYNKLRDLCRLYELHELTGSTSKMIETAKIILSKGSADYYPKLKALLQAGGEWEASYKPVLELCKRNLSTDSYMKILKDEGELALLFEQLKKRPDQIYTYGGLLSGSYREEVQKIFDEKIRQVASRATKREDYRHVAGLIKNFSQSGYTAQAKLMIEEFVQTYKRRPAFVEELGIAGKQL